MTGEELLKRVNKEIDVLSSPKIVDALVEASKAKAPEPHLNLSEEMPKVIEHHIENFKKVAEGACKSICVNGSGFGSTG